MENNHAIELGRFTLRGKEFIVFQTSNPKRPVVIHNSWEATEEDYALFRDASFLDAYKNEITKIWNERQRRD